MTEATKLDAQRMYRLVRDNGWTIKRTRRMKGMSLHVTSGDRPGQFAAAFGHYGMIPGDIDGELAAWRELARDWNHNDFWQDEPD